MKQRDNSSCKSPVGCALDFRPLLLVLLVQVTSSQSVLWSLQRTSRTCARLWQALSAGLGLCASSSTLKCLIHSDQSSLVTRALLSQALRNALI